MRSVCPWDVVEFREWASERAWHVDLPLSRCNNVTVPSGSSRWLIALKEPIECSDAEFKCF